MKLTVNKNLFENIIASMQPFLDKKDASNITSHIYIEANQNLIIKATDHEMGLEANINDVMIEENGKATVNGSNLLNIIRRLKNEDLNIEIIENFLHITQNKSSFKLPMFDPEEYPLFPNYENLNILQIETTTFIDSIRKITPSIDTNNPKHELNGALIDIKEEKINFVSTDTKRLSLVSLENFSNSPMNLIIPKKAIIEIQKLFFDEAVIKYDEIYLVVSNDRLTFHTKLTNGNFPDYNRIIPNNFNKLFNVDKSTLIEGIKLVTSLKPHIKIEFQPNSIKFETIDDDIEAKTEISTKIDINEDIFIGINSKYILDFLSSINNNKIQIGFNQSDMPICFKDNNFISIIMPIVLK